MTLLVLISMNILSNTVIIHLVCSRSDQWPVTTLSDNFPYTSTRHFSYIFYTLSNCNFKGLKFNKMIYIYIVIKNGSSWEKAFSKKSIRSGLDLISTPFLKEVPTKIKEIKRFEFENKKYFLSVARKVEKRLNFK